MENAEKQLLAFFLMFIPSLFLIATYLAFMVNMSAYGPVSQLPYLILIAVPLVLSIIFFFGSYRRIISLVTVIYATCVYAFSSFEATRIPWGCEANYLMIWVNVLILIFGGVAGLLFNPRKGKKKFGF